MRNRANIDKTINKFLKTNIKQLSSYLRNVLRISVYQYLFLEKIPPYAIVNEAVNLVYNKKDKNFINAVLRNIFRSDIKKGEFILKRNWLKTMLAREYGEETARSIISSFTTRPRYCLRINSLSANRAVVIKILKQLGIEFRSGRWLNEYLIVNRLAPIRNHSILKSGMITVQDEAEGLVAHLLDPQPGETIIDFCAGPGGKTSHIAELMEDTAHVIAIDVDPEQLHLVAENRTRLNLNNIFPILADGRRITNFLADRILVDAPCSNLGTLRKRPEVLDWLKPNNIERLSNLQLALLTSAAQNLKPGGILVYSTCTILSDENEKVIERFLTEYNFEIEPAEKFLPKGLASKFLKILPHQFDTDGVFAVRMKRR